MALNIAQIVVQKIQELRARLNAERKAMNDYEMSAVIDAAASTTTSASLQVPANGDFQIEGYNVSFELTAAGVPSLRIKIQDETSGIPFSPDPVPIELVATPGAIVANTAPIRYGMRLWSYTIPANAKLNIQIENSDVATRQVRITFKGKLLKA